MTDRRLSILGAGLVAAGLVRATLQLLDVAGRKLVSLTNDSGDEGQVAWRPAP